MSAPQTSGPGAGKGKPGTGAGDTAGRQDKLETAWEREWSALQRRANTPRTPMLGCSTISHERLGFCAACVRVSRDGAPSGGQLEVMGWRLLALKPEGGA